MVLLETSLVSSTPTGKQSTRESFTACIVPLISIVLACDELQPTSLTLVQLNSPTHTSIMEIPPKHTHVIVEHCNNANSRNMHPIAPCLLKSTPMNTCHKLIATAISISNIYFGNKTPLQ